MKPKRLARSIALIASLLLPTLILSNCGSTSSANSTTLAYLQNSAGGYQSNLAMAATARFATAHRSASRKSLKTRLHMAHALASGATNLASGSVDAYLMDSRTGAVAKLNSQSGLYNGIQLSPDGSKVAFTAFDSAGYSQVFVATISNFDNPTQLTLSDTADRVCPKFSPDGATIISSVLSQDVNSNLTLAVGMVPVAGGSETLIAPSGLLPISPVFTPDGKKIIFTAAGGSSVNSTYSGFISIFSMNLDGSGVTQLSGVTGTYADILPSVSPDGSKIVFTRITPNSGGTGYVSNIYVMAIAGESVANPATQLTTDGYSWNATFLKNNITFASMRDSPTTMTDNIYEMDVTGANLTRLTTTSAENAFNLFSNL